MPFTYVTTPTLTGLSPGQGPAAGGTTVTLTGSNFTGATTVLFGGVAASFTVDSGTQITAVTPAHAAGATAVTVTTADRGISWIGGVIRFGDGVIGGPMDTPRNPPRVVHHTTESPAGGKYLEAVASYLIRVAAEPHLIYCPVTDRVGQFGPLHHSARALRNDGSRRTNREGLVHVQIEVLGRAAMPWTDGWDPREKPGWQRILAALRFLGCAGPLAGGPSCAVRRGSGTPFTFCVAVGGRTLRPLPRTGQRPR
ncbi:IPT/TIG domain-containing protein [Streptomyces tailanensis]|uniref:IPT/TIG domain-containing protein n=1 Tax=Streptomyces tailanensis TaxID=2569858 RepID=UPI00155A66D6|nr:IPT/TIG domain-containing protein [Streptomyces tailanensis]